MPESGEDQARMLKALRDRIDDIDCAMHRLLIERGTVIEELIRTKGTSRPGAAFRPMREAEMMRNLVKRHTGVLPLPTVEHIWREIITTFTRMQAPFNVAVDVSVEPDRMRDLARFMFGFSVDLVPLADTEAVISDVAAKGDLGLIARKARGPWWQALARPKAPRIMALLPFIETARDTGIPAFVISPQLTDETPLDVTAYAASLTGPLKRVDDVEVLAVAATSGATETLVAAATGVPVAERLRQAGVAIQRAIPIGGFARGIAVGRASTALGSAVGGAGRSA
jgi:chorismate mutase